MAHSMFFAIGLSFCLLAGQVAPTGCGAAALLPQVPERKEFDGRRALEDVAYQVDLGPRLPGSEAHRQAVDWMVSELDTAGWEVEVQETTILEQPVRNVVADWGEGRPWVVIGAHYDSRMIADQDPNTANRQKPVPGANDGASGVAVLLELARVLPLVPADDLAPGRVTLVLFDAEDNGRIEGWDWILGSRAYVASLDEKPDAAVVIDMIGDADLNIYQEQNSDPILTKEIWAEAAGLGYSEQIIAQPKYRILDDHMPFIEAGIPAVDLIDFDYPYWHTLADTTDKISPESLDIVGKTLLAWLIDSDENSQ